MMKNFLSTNILEQPLHSWNILSPRSLPSPRQGHSCQQNNNSSNTTWSPRSTHTRTLTKTRPRSSAILCSTSASENTVMVSSKEEEEEEEEEEASVNGAEVVRMFYGGINDHDLSSVEGLIADKCVYEDLIFPRPFVGRQAIMEFFQKFIGSVSKDLQFVIDDISEEDPFAIGVTWHLEWRKKPFPFSKGCSFYRLEIINNKTQIIYGRDSVEPAIKPGESALAAIRGVTWLLQQFPQLADRF